MRLNWSKTKLFNFKCQDQERRWAGDPDTQRRHVALVVIVQIQWLCQDRTRPSTRPVYTVVQRSCTRPCTRIHGPYMKPIEFATFWQSVNKAKQ